MEENQMEEQEPPLNFISGDAHFANWQELVPVSAISSSHIKIHSETITKQNGNLSLKLAKRMKKSEATETNGGGRIIRAAGRKDRHSKVCTARGTRDRRVRLSPNTAIQFYDVQDRLGYDRPSKAIDWLMKEARAAIDALDEPPPAAAGSVHFVPASSVGNSDYDPGNGEIQPEDVVSLSEGNFGFFSNNMAGYSGGLECFPAAPLTTPVGTFDANLEMARILTWNYGNYSPPPHHFSGHSFLGQAQFVSQREPLQSSYSRITNYNRASTCRIPGFGFSSEELPGFTTPEGN